MLLRHILLTENAEKYMGKKIMDLGAGMGVVGITLAKMINCDVTMTDYIPEVLALCQENIDKNYTPLLSTKKPQCLHLD